MKKLFKKPKWLKPEINETVYYVHIGIIILTIYGLMSLYDPTKLSTALMLVVWAVYFTIGDIVSHTILKLN